MTKSEKLVSALVILVGFLSMFGSITGIDSIKGIGFMSTASPLPLVFSKFRGVENFSSDYFMKIKFTDGEERSLQLTSKIYDKAKGPYNRRNPYGAVLAYGPMLTKANEVLLRDSVMEYSACGQANFMKEIGIEKPISHILVTLKSKTLAKPVWNFEVHCQKEGQSHESI